MKKDSENLVLPISKWVLLEMLHKQPASIFNNFDVRLSIDLLRLYAKNGNQSQSKEARNLLKECGLKLFIPQNSHHRKTENSDLRWYQNNLPALLNIISSIEEQIEEITLEHNPKKKKYNFSEKKTLSEKICKTILQDHYEDDKDLVAKVSEGEKGSNKTNLALSMFSYSQDISYTALHKFYFSKEVSERRKEFLDIKYKDLPIVDLGYVEMPDQISKIELKQHPEHGSAANRLTYIYHINIRFSEKKIPSFEYYMDLLSLVRKEAESD